MSNALTTALQALQNDHQRMTVISHNLVNAMTPGYKREVAVSRSFGATFDAKAEAGGGMAAPQALGLVPRPETRVDLTAGTTVHTGKPFDLALDGDGYFEITGRQGVGYARGGSFHLDAGGRLVDATGAPVSGQDGPITVTGRDVSVDRDGQVLQNGRPVAQLKRVRFPAGMLAKGEDGLLRPPASAAAEPAPSDAAVRVGYLENANVSAMREMVAMLETLRNFEALQKLVQGYDEQIGTALQKLAEF